MINIRDEQTTTTTIPEEPGPGRTSTAPSGSTEGEGGFRTLFQWQGHRPRMTVRVAFFGGLAGAIFFFGLAAAILSGHFWEVFLVVLAMCSLVSSLSSSKTEAIYAGIEVFVLLLGLAVLAFTGWWWPGILVVLGIAALLGIGYGLLTLWPVARPGVTVDQYYTALKNHNYARAYHFLDMSLPTSLPLEQFTQMAKEREAAEGAISKYSIAPDLAVATKPLPGEPLPLVTFSGKPAETFIVQVIRANGTAYPVHLQVRQVGKRWAISAFDCI